MFSKRITLPNRKFDKDFFKTFVNELREAGFKEIKIRLPHNLINNSEKDLIEVDEFISRERNYVSVILNATNIKNKETIKILFINESTKAFFKDNTFPSGHSEPFGIFVQGSDPARVFALTGYLKERLSGMPFWNYIFWLSYFFSLIGFILELVSYSSRGKFIFQIYLNNYLWDIVFFIYSFIFMFRLFSRQKGLYIKSRDKEWYQWVLTLLKGEYANNPLVTFIVTIVAGVVLYFLYKIFDILFF